MTVLVTTLPRSASVPRVGVRRTEEAQAYKSTLARRINPRHAPKPQASDPWPPVRLVLARQPPKRASLAKVLG